MGLWVGRDCDWERRHRLWSGTATLRHRHPRLASYPVLRDLREVQVIISNAA
jgi:hypothetical protein